MIRKTGFIRKYYFQRGYGFIFGADSKEYFFNIKNLSNSSSKYIGIKRRDIISFDETGNPQKNKNKVATNIIVVYRQNHEYRKYRLQKKI